MKRRILSWIMMIAIILCSIPLSIPVLAKESLPSISGSSPVYTYTYKSSGRIYRYTNSSLTTKESGHWIDCATDECKIIEIQNNAVKVVYPTSSGPKTGWFVRSEFCKGDLKADQAKYSFRATKKITTYRWKENNTVYGYISQGDKTYLLRGDQNSTWLQVLYPVSGGYKMAWVKGDDLFATSIKLNMTSISRQGLGWSETLTATLSPSNSADSVTWSSSNSAVAKVSGSGVVSAVGYGNATITATTKRGKTASVTVSVIQPSVPRHYIDLNGLLDGKDKWDLNGLATVDVYINGSLNQANVSDYYIEWPEGTKYEIRNIKTKSGYKYDSIKNGSGTVGTGKVDIRVVLKTDKPATVAVTGIKLNKSSASVSVGKTVTLTAAISPSDATDKSVTWSSSNTKVATVSGGKVKGVAAGTATITAKSNNGKTATAKVTVSKITGAGPSNYKGKYSGTPDKGKINGNSFYVFSQKDKEWGSYSYKKGTINGKYQKTNIYHSGCHLLSLVNGTYWLTGEFISPKWLAKYAMDKGYRTNGNINMSGLYNDISRNYGSKYGIKYVKCVNNFSDLKTYLKKGYIGLGGGKGHVMTFAAYSGDKFLVLDSYFTYNGHRYVWKTQKQMTGRFNCSYFYIFKKK